MEFVSNVAAPNLIVSWELKTSEPNISAMTLQFIYLGGLKKKKKEIRKLHLLDPGNLDHPSHVG